MMQNLNFLLRLFLSDIYEMERINVHFRIVRSFGTNFHSYAFLILCIINKVFVKIHYDVLAYWVDFFSVIPSYAEIISTK